jgi:hypothetical protein
MKTNNHTHELKVQATRIPEQMTAVEAKEAASALSLYYRNGTFTCQNFFTPPRVGQVNWIQGLETEADLHFRFIHQIGPTLFHAQVVGDEAAVRRMCGEHGFYQLLRNIETRTFALSVLSAPIRHPMW